MQQDNYTILLEKLNDFIKKFYKNQIIKGTLICVSIFLLFSLFIFLLEFIGHFSIISRTFLFYLYVIVSLFIGVKFIIIPFLKLNKIGSVLSNNQAADIIGKHFGQVNDKLLNALQLKEMQHNNVNEALLTASIDQKINDLKPIPFSSIIDFKSNKKYVKYLLIPLLIITFILIKIPEVITGPVVRIMHHRTYYAKPLPFQIIILNKKLETIQHADFNLQLKVTGTEYPDELMIQTGNIKYKFTKENASTYSYKFKDLQHAIKFSIVDNANFISPEYSLNVLPKPVLLGFDIQLIYPSYINKKPENIKNTGDISIPEGTKVIWHFFTRETESMFFHFNTDKTSVLSIKDNDISYSKVIRESGKYAIKLKNRFFTQSDSIIYFINSIPDALPSIDIQQMSDSVLQNQVYFKGLIKDDYGFTKLALFINSTKENKEKFQQIIPVNINKNQLSNTFYLDFDFSKYVESTDKIEFYFQVWDNDAINGFKSVKSDINFIDIKSQNKIEDNINALTDKLENKLEKMEKKSSELLKKADDLSKKLNENKELNWQDQKDIKNMLQEFNELEKTLEQFQEEKQLKEMYEDKVNENPIDAENKEKMEQLNKLFEDLFTPELKAKMEELQKLMEQYNKDKAQDALKDLKYDAKDLQKALDRNLELFKQLEFEKNLANTINKLDELSKEQEKLSNEMDKSKTQEEKIQKQSDINEKFEQIKKDIDDLNKKNSELEEANKLENTEQNEKEVEKELNNSKENIQNKKDSKAQQNQKNAAKQMDKLKETLEKTQEDMEEQESEQIEDLRQILENLIKSSFNQEQLMNKFKSVSPSSPTYPQLVKDQNKIKDDIKIIEDSLFALSKRQPAIESVVIKELNNINNSIAEAISGFQDIQSIKYLYTNPIEKKNASIAKQQVAMTSMNNLALMLAESLEQAQQKKNQKQSKGKKKQCKNPQNSCNSPSSGKKQSMKSMQQMQEKLNQQIESLKNSGQPKPGNSTSKQFAKMAYEQSLIRQQLNKMRNQVNGIDQNMSNQLRKMSESMNQTEKELINKTITQQTIQRQKEILTRMLESEKSGLFQEMEKKRESREQKNDIFSNPFQKMEYNTLKRADRDKLQYEQPIYNSFYKSRINNYFIKFDK